MLTYRFTGGPHDGLELTLDQINQVGFTDCVPATDRSGLLFVFLPDGESLEKALGGDAQYALPRNYPGDRPAGSCFVYVVLAPGDQTDPARPEALHFSAGLIKQVYDAKKPPE